MGQWMTTWLLEHAYDGPILCSRLAIVRLGDATRSRWWASLQGPDGMTTPIVELEGIVTIVARKLVSGGWSMYI